MLHEVGEQKTVSFTIASIVRLSSDHYGRQQNDDGVIVDDAVKGPDHSRFKPGFNRLRRAADVQEQSSSDGEEARKETDEFVSHMKANEAGKNGRKKHVKP